MSDIFESLYNPASCLSLFRVKLDLATVCADVPASGRGLAWAADSDDDDRVGDDTPSSWGIGLNGQDMYDSDKSGANDSSC